MCSRSLWMRARSGSSRNFLFVIAMTSPNGPQHGGPNKTLLRSAKDTSGDRRYGTRMDSRQRAVRSPRCRRVGLVKHVRLWWQTGVDTTLTPRVGPVEAKQRKYLNRLGTVAGGHWDRTSGGCCVKAVQRGVQLPDHVRKSWFWRCDSFAQTRSLPINTSKSVWPSTLREHWQVADWNSAAADTSAAGSGLLTI